jgi:hypothetical protein
MATVTVAEVPMRAELRPSQFTAVEYDGPVFVANNVNRGGVADIGETAYVLKGDYDNGYGIFLNFVPNTGLIYPGGTMIADEFILGNGFQPGKDFLTGFEIKIYRSVLDPGDGKTLADITVELWDGDPFGIWETAGATGIIASATFEDIPGPAVGWLHADIPKTPVDDTQLWIVLSATETCRLGWRLSGIDPEVGDIWMGADNIAAFQTDYDAGYLGAPGFCHCTDETDPCTYPTDPCPFQDWQCGYLLVSPPCDGTDDGPWFLCSDGDAESAWIYALPYGCTGAIDDFCTSFVANIFSQSDFTVTLQPKKSDPAGTIDGTEIKFAKGGAHVWMDVIFANWGSEGNTVKTWQMKLNSDGYYSGVNGTLTPWNPPCTSNADCQAAHQHGLFTNQCNDPAYPPGGCNPAFQDFAANDPACFPAPMPGQPCLGLQIPACSLSTLDFICGSTINDWPQAPDDGNPHYGATVVLEVSPEAAGTFTVQFDIGNTWMKDGNNPIRMIAHVPAKITIQTGQCCDMSIPPGYPFVCLTDTVTENQCNQIGVDLGIPVKFDPDADCGDPCGCTDDYQCDDGDACTVDECIDNVCVYSAVDCDDGEFCTLDYCDPDAVVTWPADGCYTEPRPVDDGLFCTNDWCDEVNDVVMHDKVDCTDDIYCTLDQCVELADGYECQNIDMNGPITGGEKHGFLCPSGDPAEDCLDTIDQYTGEQLGIACDVNPTDGLLYCICSICYPPDHQELGCDDPQSCRANLNFEISPSSKWPDADPNCFAKSEKIFVDVIKTPGGVPVPIAVPITAVQFTVKWDPSCMVFQDWVPGMDFPFVIDYRLDEVAGELFMALGVDPFGGEGVPGEAHVAAMSFVKASGCTNCNLDFCDEEFGKYGTYMADDAGWKVCADTYPSKEIHENDKLTLKVPADMKVNVDCDAVTAMVEWDEPWATSSCFDPDCDPQQAPKCYEADLDCWGAQENGNPFPLDVVMGGGEMPLGVNSFWCITTSSVCGDTLQSGWTVTVNEMTSLDVEIQLEPVILAEEMYRCITFELYADCVQDPLVFQEMLPFGSKWDHIGHFTGDLKIPDTGQWVCIAAIDQQHSLRAVADIVCADDGVYYAEFKGDPKFFGGNWLTQGNLDGWKKVGETENVIDIMDFGTFVSLFGTTPPPPDCETKHDGPHGDLNGDGVVDHLDFAFIMRNYMQNSLDACCPDGIGSVTTGRSEVSVGELRQMGLSELIVADLNGDGLINTDDMAAFAQGFRPEQKKPRNSRLQD